MKISFQPKLYPSHNPHTQKSLSFLYTSRRGQGKHTRGFAWGAGRGLPLQLHGSKPRQSRRARRDRHDTRQKHAPKPANLRTVKFNSNSSLNEWKEARILCSSSCEPQTNCFFQCNVIFGLQCFWKLLMCASEREMESPGEEAGRSTAPANGSNKIIGRNVNGTSKSHSVTCVF